MPRTKAAFEAALGEARQRIGLAVQDLSGLIGPWFEAYREARTALDAAGNASAGTTKTAAAKAVRPLPGANSRCRPRRQSA